MVFWIITLGIAYLVKLFSTIKDKIPRKLISFYNLSAGLNVAFQASYLYTSIYEEEYRETRATVFSLLIINAWVRLLYYLSFYETFRFNVSILLKIIFNFDIITFLGIFVILAFGFGSSHFFLITKREEHLQRGDF
jgi:apolipoprotein N-acyltransferase